MAGSDATANRNGDDEWARKRKPRTPAANRRKACSACAATGRISAFDAITNAHSETSALPHPPEARRAVMDAIDPC
jgi:hypothetical protein